MSSQKLHSTAFSNADPPCKTNTVSWQSTSHLWWRSDRLSGTLWLGNGLKITPGAAEQVIQDFWLSKKKTEMKLGIASARLDQSSTCFIWPYLQFWHCRPHRLHRSHCWLLLPLLLHILFHVWRGRMRKQEICFRKLFRIFKLRSIHIVYLSNGCVGEFVLSTEKNKLLETGSWLWFL